jgi:hypothetical protein
MVHRAGQLVQAMEEGEAATWENRDEVSLGSADQGKFRTRIEIGYDRYRQFSEQLRADPATVFFYDFEMDATAADILRDRAANGGEKIDGKLRDCIWVSGRWRDKGALLFDRDEAAVQLDFPDGRNKFDVFTMSAWVQIAPADIAYQTLFDSCKFYEKGFFNWRVGRAGTIVSGVRRCFEVTSPEGTVPFSRWGHHAVVVNSTTGAAEYFLDGQVVEQVEWRGKTRLKFGECLIGLYVPHVPREWTFASELHGRIDEFAMFSREFSHREIKAIYDAGKGFE